jgi:hypothetical protein
MSHSIFLLPASLFGMEANTVFALRSVVDSKGSDYGKKYDAAFNCHVFRRMLTPCVPVLNAFPEYTPHN